MTHPDDCRRLGASGHPVLLADGKLWLIPNCSKLPPGGSRDAATWLSRLAEEVGVELRKQLAGEQPCYPGAYVLAVASICWNYTISPEDAELLIDGDSMARLLLVACGAIDAIGNEHPEIVSTLTEN